MLGDSVNLAARLEGINKLYGTSIIISESTYNQVSEQFLCRQLDIVAVKGKTQGVPIYELLNEIDGDPSELAKPLAYYQDYEKAFAAYLKQQWQEASDLLKALLEDDAEDKAVLLILSRCDYYKDHTDELPADWDGTTTLKSK